MVDDLLLFESIASFVLVIFEQVVMFKTSNSFKKQ
jgi:hypothetical protein